MRVTSGRCFAMLVSVTVGAAAMASGAESRPRERVSPLPQCNPNAIVWRSPEPPADPQEGDVWVDPKTKMEMVYIGPGKFIMGSAEAEIESWLRDYPADKRSGKRKLFRDQEPAFRVHLKGYWMGRTEVTNAQYLRFVQATGHRPPEHWKGGQIPEGLADFPVVLVSWQEARDYCTWAGDRLPTEMEWEKAARGSDGRAFPWGSSWRDEACRMGQGRSEQATRDPIRDGPAAVGSYPTGASPYGCLDMAGNVYEWCSDYYEESAYRRYAKGDLKPPKPGPLRANVLRGGSWEYTYALREVYRCAHRYFSWMADMRENTVGFRGARSAR